MPRDLTPIRIRRGGVIGGIGASATTHLNAGNVDTLASSRPYVVRKGGLVVLDDFWLTVSSLPPVSSSNGHTTLIGDIVHSYSGTTIATNAQVTVHWVGTPPANPAFSASIQGPASYADGVLSRNDSVTGEVMVTLELSRNGVSRSVTASVAWDGTGVVETGSALDTASLRYGIDAYVRQVVGSQNAGTALSRFSSRSFDGNGDITYTLNPAFWARDHDLTCVSIGNSQAGVHRGGTLVSPQHVIFATHYPISNGRRLYYVDAAGALVTRTLAAQQTITGTDIIVGKLDSPVPAGVNFARVLPVNHASYAPNGHDGVPVCHFDQFGRCSISKGLGGTSADTYFNKIALALSGNLSGYLNTTIGGDSGQPLLLLLPGQTVLGACFHVPSGGPGIRYYRTQVNAAMTALGGGYQLTDADFSNFNTY